MERNGITALNMAKLSGSDKADLIVVVIVRQPGNGIMGAVIHIVLEGFPLKIFQRYDIGHADHL